MTDIETTASEQTLDGQSPNSTETVDDYDRKIGQLKAAYEARLICAHMRTEAVRAGMLDLDGLKLADLSKVSLGQDDKLVGARELIEALRRTKPWLFGAMASSSSAAAVPASQPVRQKSALEMTDEEYSAARATLVGRRF